MIVVPMPMTETDRQTLEELERRLQTLLPESYQDRYEEVQPVSMGSAGLKYGLDGKVAWNDMWATFCDLAMAGGPPHKGMLLEPAPAREVEASLERYASVIAEICRGITMVTDLDAEGSSNPGWVRVECLTRAMAAWLVRAISMENVAVRADGVMLELPAGPRYRLDKEIKNVVTAIAKTTHYWQSHMSIMQRSEIAALLEGMEGESPLVAPSYNDDDAELRESVAAGAAEVIRRQTGLVRSAHRYFDWLGIECSHVRAAVWLMRMMSVLNVVARREGSVLFVPINHIADPDGEVVASSLGLAYRLGVGEGVV
jgi:sirohydrochlorin cobaltochelatase